MGDFVLPDQGLGIAKISFWFPSVFSSGVSLPSDKESPMTGSSPVSDDCSDLIFFFTIYKVQWWLEVVGTMLHSFLVG